MSKLFRPLVDRVSGAVGGRGGRVGRIDRVGRVGRVGRSSAEALTALVGAALILSAWTAASGASSTTTSTTSSTTTSTTSAGLTAGTTTTTSAKPSAADTWLLRAIGTESKVGSVRINGSIKQGKTSITLNLLVNGNGEGGGSFVQDGSTIKLTRVGPLLYFNAPTKFWAKHATAAQTKTYGGKWIEVSALNTQFESFDQFLNAGDLVAAVFAGHTTPLKVSRATKYEGHKVVIVSDTIVSKGKKSTGQIYISDKGAARALKIVDKSPTEDGVIVFSHYGKAVSIVTPPEPINLT